METKTYPDRADAKKLSDERSSDPDAPSGRVASAGIRADVESDPLFDTVFEAIANRLLEDPTVDVDTLANEYPLYADQLAYYLPAMRALANVGQMSGDGSAAEIGDPLIASHSPIGVLGDFRIIREIGRGGMGVVYEAEQISLGRRMALKVLPFASVLDGRQLERFKREAQAAAHLKHPNIVGVHSVGCERGVHYYAMEYIEGQTLAQLITRMRADENEARAEAAKGGPEERSASGGGETQPAAALSTQRSGGSQKFFRSVARIGKQAAEALDYTHEMGIVHRDMKPSNLLVDQSSQLWVTDFGLAMAQSDASLTMTGDVLGTLRYMSPEQASGRRHLTDHRTDIYSLGITLYELLSLRPAFDGNERQVLLRRITEEEPRSPRQIDPAIPKDLETIVLKAIAKEPQSRYATAGALAEDFSRFIEDRSIRAKRPSLAERSARWMRRHTSLVMSVAVVLAVALVFLTASLVLLNRERTKTVGEQRRAEANLDLALEALDNVYLGFVGEQLKDQPGLTLSQRDFLGRHFSSMRNLLSRTMSRWTVGRKQRRPIGDWAGSIKILGPQRRLKSPTVVPYQYCRTIGTNFSRDILAI